VTRSQIAFRRRRGFAYVWSPGQYLGQRLQWRPMTRITGWTNDGMRFDARDQGPLDGAPVVLLHGFPQRASSWDAVAPTLHDAGLRTIVPEQRGYSPDARPRRRRHYTVDRLVGDVVSLVGTVGRPVHLVGHDWGAAVAWFLAAQHPGLVRSLVAVSVPHPAAFAAALVSSRQLLRSWYLALFQLPRLPERLLASPRGEAAFAAGGMTPEMLERYRTEVVADGALRGGLMWYRGMPLSRSGALRARVSAPTTMVWSDRDVAVDRRGAELSRRWVDGPFELAVLEGVSHWVPEEAPTQLADLVRERAATAAGPGSDSMTP
jgi:pimeloyl-ACP methyl ester carboxylesterase